MTTEIIRIMGTFKGDYGSVFEQIISIEQDGNIVILKEKELKQLEKIMNAKFLGI